MMDSSWSNPWKLTSLGLGLVVVTALATTLVVANWTGKESDKAAAAGAGSGPAVPAVAASQAPVTAPAAAPAAAPVSTPGVPTRTAVEACNQYAANQAGQRDKTVDTVKDVGIGAIAGAALGAAGGAIAGGGSGAGKGAAIGGLVGAGGGTLYGLNENKKHDEHYRGAYAACMRSRGYTG